MMMRNLIPSLLPASRTLTFVCVAFLGLTVLGCSSTEKMSKIQIGSSSPQVSSDFHLVDARTQESRVYSQSGNIQYLGDSSFEVPPIRLVAARFDEKLGGLLKGKEITLSEFQVRITAPYPQTYPGMPLASEVLGKTLGIPQLGYPHYANVSLRGRYQQKEFSGSKSIEFYLGSGESEITEAFNAAVSAAASNLQSLLMDENRAPLDSGK